MQMFLNKADELLALSEMTRTFFWGEGLCFSVLLTKQLYHWTLGNGEKSHPQDHHPQRLVSVLCISFQYYFSISHSPIWQLDMITQEKPSPVFYSLLSRNSSLKLLLKPPSNLS